MGRYVVLLSVVFWMHLLGAEPLGKLSPHIVVDQFGYLPGMNKIAVLRDPQQGYDAKQSYQAAPFYEVRDSSTNKTSLVLEANAWKQGQVHGQKTDPRYLKDGGDSRFGSGDRVWHLDFSALKQAGEYYIYDPEKKLRSAEFKIAEDVYHPLFRAAFKTFFYQRFNQAKQAPFAEPAGQDDASHAQLKTETEGVYHINDCWAFHAQKCPDVDHIGDCSYKQSGYIYELDHPWRQDLKKAAKRPVRDMSGGWYDAGDYNKYVLYSDGTINELLYTYEDIPRPARKAAFWDDLGIPESGNGVNDLLDEIKWELDWLLKMQITPTNSPDCQQKDTCGLFNFKHGVLNWGYRGAPSGDQTLRCYASPSISATLAATNALAHAAVVYQQIKPLHTYAQQLYTTAAATWERLKRPELHGKLLSNPQKSDFLAFKAYDNDGLRAKGASKTQFQHTGKGLEDDGYSNINGNKVYEYESVRLMAAIFLYAATPPEAKKRAEYHQYIKNFVHKDSVLLSGCGLNVTERSCKHGFYLQGKGVNAEMQEALFYYARLPDADKQLKALIEKAYVYAAETSPYNSITPYLNAERNDDPYMAFIDDYMWGSNAAKSRYAIPLLNIANAQLGAHNKADYRRIAGGYLHYLHGLNPLSQVYLTNMHAYGAENSVMRFYHLWFNKDTPLTKPPLAGFLVGGANQFFQSRKVLMPESRERLDAQPRQKAFKAFNEHYGAYQLSENGIYYQAAYLRLLQHFINPQSE